MAGQKILVVDDDVGTLRLIELNLKRAGYRVLVAVRGEEAIDQVRVEKPDLVLMDVMMPGIDGFETTRRIRRLPEGRHIPIIFLSARSDVEGKVTGLRIGGDDYITKPVSMREVMAHIEAHLRPHAAALGHLIVVLGSKPGVGTTTIVVNLALALRQVSRKKIILVDWQRPLGDVAFFLDLVGTYRLESLLPNVEALTDRAFNASLQQYVPGVKVLLGATDPTSAKRMTHQALSNVLKTALTRADYVLVDGGAFFSWRVPPLAESGEGINLCVLTPELTAIKRAVRIKTTAGKAHRDLWFLLNRDGTTGGVAREKVESFLRNALKVCVPDDSDQVSRALNKGRPVYIVDSELGFSRAVEEMASLIHGHLS